MNPPVTMIEKIWNSHVVADLGDGMFLVHIDRILLHDRGGGTALRSLSDMGRRVRNPASVFATTDHVIDTLPGRNASTTKVPGGVDFIRELILGTSRHGIRLFDSNDERQGIVHVISPEQGIALPGCTLVCNDSHTCTVGGVSALGWGIGSSQIEHALATQTLVLNKPKTMRVTLSGKPASWVTAKDVVLHLIGAIGADGGNGYTVEFAGPATMGMPVEERLTLCNLAVEFAARSGIVAPDDATFQYLAQTPFAPKGEQWDLAVAHWRDLASDQEAIFDKQVAIDCGDLAPQITWGTSPGQVLTIDGRVPEAGSSRTRSYQADERAYAYMGLLPGMAVEGLPIDGVFLGSCTNSRLSDLRSAARVLSGQKVAKGVRALCVPGSSRVKRLAEEEGLDQIFLKAGFEWRESGCSICFNAGGEHFGPGQRVVTSTNRNFEDRQGPETRSHLASPATVAASAILGRIADVRKLDIRT